jgi:hypothetical protein
MDKGLGMTNDRMRLRHVAVLLAAAWFAVHVALYVGQIFQLDLPTLRAEFGVLWQFFGRQTAAFVALTLVVAFLRPGMMGRALVMFWALSTVALLVASRSVGTAVGFPLLALWAACTVRGMRSALARSVGDRYATWGVAAAAVYAALVPLCFLLGVLHALTPWIVAPLAVAAALPGLVGWARRLPTLPRDVLPRLDRIGVLDVFLIQTIWVVLAVGFVSASTSEVVSDAVRVHLPYIHQIVADHGISHQYACWHRLQPMAAQTCCAAFACVGSDAAAKWFSWLAIAALALLAAEEVSRRAGSPRLGLLAAAAVLGCPLLLWLSATLYIDHVITLLCVAGFIVLFRALRPPCLRGILLSAALIGSMIQVKYTGLVFCAVWGAWLCVALGRHCGWRIAARWSAAAGAALVLVALPWYVYVALGTGNPFYPYLHRCFPSPYWADSVAIQQILESNFKVGPGIGRVLSFPWVATYGTHRFLENQNGFLGFWALALAPCWFLVRPRCGAAFGDMAVAGAAMIAGIVLYTPYVRYWLPAYPLLVISCVLAAGWLTSGLRWRIEGQWRESLSKNSPLPLGDGSGVTACPRCTTWKAISPQTALTLTLSQRERGPRTATLRTAAQIAAGTALAALLLLPAVFSCLGLPWGEYTGRVGRDQRLAERFPGYEAVKRLNAILRPDDGVICSGYEGVYLVAGRPYGFEPMWNGVHRIHDAASFAAFCRRHHIRYWIVDRPFELTRSLQKTDAYLAAYWTESRMVAMAATAAVYDLAEEHPNTWTIAARHEWPSVLERTTRPWTHNDTAAHWVNLTTEAATSPAKGIIDLEGNAWIAHRFAVELPGGICRVQLGMWSRGRVTSALEITWHDAAGNLVGRTRAAACGESDREPWICSQAPSGAAFGWVYLRNVNQQQGRLKRAALTFWKPHHEVEAAQRNTAAGAAGGIR